MGLFSFVKNAGASLFGKKKKETPKEEAPKNENAPLFPDTNNNFENEMKGRELYTMVLGLGLGIQDLVVSVNDETVTCSGVAASQADREKVILALGNVDGIATVDADIQVEASNEPEAQFYTVVKGDYLSKIAKKMYGDAMKYPVIFEANKPMLTDPDKIYPGQVLRIPALQA